jgi:hypothetical protein
MIDCYLLRIACRFIAWQHYKEILARTATPGPLDGVRFKILDLGGSIGDVEC